MRAAPGGRAARRRDPAAAPARAAAAATSARSTRRSGRSARPRDGGALQLGGCRRPRPRRARTAARRTSWSRTTSAPAAVATATAFGDDTDIYYAAKAFLSQGGGALDPRGGPLARRRDRRRARDRARRGLPGRADPVARQQQVGRRSSRRPSMPASVGSSSTATSRSPGLRTPPRRPGSGSGCWCASRSASRPTPTSSSRPPTRTRSSASRWRAAPRWKRYAASSRCRRSSWSACTATSARRSSTPPASRSPPTGSSGCSRTIRDALGVELPELDLGGGLGIAYTERRRPGRRRRRREAAPCDRRARVRRRRRCRCRGWRSSPAGRSSDPAGVTLYEVGTIKDVDHIRTYVSVDGGMSDNIRTALYGSDVHLRPGLASRATRADARAGGRQALRGRRHHRARRLAARRPGARRPARGRRDRRLLPLDGQQLQRRPAAAGRRGRGRAQPRCCCAASRSTTCSPWTRVTRAVAATAGRKLRIAMLGCGVVGSEVARLLERAARGPRRTDRRRARARRDRGAPAAAGP